MRSLFIPLIFAGILLGQAALAKSDKTRCKSNELDRKVCFLKVGKASYRFSSTNVAIDDGTWKGVEELPLSGEKTQWHALQLDKINGRDILQFQIWAEPKTSARIQSLYWYLMELKGTQLKVLHRAEVQKRRIVSSEKEDESKYIFDRAENYGLKPIEGSKIRWHVGSESGVI